VKLDCQGHTHELTGTEALRLDGQALDIAGTLIATLVEVACAHGMLVKPEQSALRKAGPATEADLVEPDP
jgi:hypothetical protein